MIYFQVKFIWDRWNIEQNKHEKFNMEQLMKPVNTVFKQVTIINNNKH